MHQLMLTVDGRQNLSNLFRLEPPWDDVSDVSEIDKQFFFANIIEQFAGAVQYSGDNAAGYARLVMVYRICAELCVNEGKPFKISPSSMNT
ncbi:hypothetical protein OSTOST_25562 [Ostertagia ostertagi]